MKSMRLAALTAIAIPAALLCAGAAHAEAPGPYVPGVGEIMGATQMRHTKLWFAGRAENWALARYELGEIKEGLGDVIAYHPVFKGAPVAALYEHYTGQPFRDLEHAIEKHDSRAFVRAYDSLTAACDDCHRAAGQGQIVIRRPTANPYTDQDFAPGKR
jgi:hypothetical protein